MYQAGSDLDQAHAVAVIQQPAWAAPLANWRCYLRLSRLSDTGYARPQDCCRVDVCGLPASRLERTNQAAAMRPELMVRGVHCNRLKGHAVATWHNSPQRVKHAYLPRPNCVHIHPAISTEKRCCEGQPVNVVPASFRPDDINST